MKALVLLLLPMVAYAKAPNDWQKLCIDKLAAANKEAGRKDKAQAKGDGVMLGTCSPKKTCFSVLVAPHSNKNGPAPTEAWSVDAKFPVSFVTERAHSGYAAKIESCNMASDAVMPLVKTFRPAVDACLAAVKP
jgi:hypothetical protein